MVGMSTSPLDAIVIGAGPNGLAAAIELARAGRSVRVYEAKPSVGGGTRSCELTDPGFVHDVCSAVHPFLLASPFFRSLPLVDLGIEAVQPEIPLAHPLEGSACALYRSVDRTAEALGADGPAYRKLMHPLVVRAEAIVEGALGPLRVPSHPLALALFGSRALLPASTVIRRTFTTAAVRGLMAGIAAHSILPLSSAPTAGVALMLALLAHHAGWPIVRGGSQKIADGLETLLRDLGGEIIPDHEVTSLGDLPAARAVLFDVGPHQMLRIAGDRFDGSFRRRLERYRYGPGVFKLDWALSEPVPWTAEVCRRAGTVHLGPTFADIASSEAAIHEGRHCEKPFVLLSQPTISDRSRAPEGKHVLWGYCHVPHASRKDMTDAVEAQIERFAPGFRDVVINRSSRDATEMQEYNANYVGGDIQAGMLTLGQLFTRPAARWSPFTTPARDIFMCSAATPPGGGVHGMCGYFAARAAMKMLRS